MNRPRLQLAVGVTPAWCTCLLVRAVFVVLVAVDAPSAALAQTVSARAFLAPAESVVAGRTFTVNLEVNGAQALDADPAPPDLDTFAQYLGQGTSTSMQIVNGRSSISLTVQYRYQAIREGSFQVPAVEVRAAGETLRTEPIRVTVTSGPDSVASPSGRTPGGGPDAESAVRPEDLFVTAEASRTRVWEGEPLVVEYRIWSRVDVASYSFTRIPNMTGFWVEELELPAQLQVEQAIRDGREYVSAVIRQFVLVPTGPGQRTIEPIGIEAEVRTRGGDLFQRFFDFGRSSVSTAVISNALAIEVDPLPARRPEAFSGVVGALDVFASLDRDSVAVNEAVTLTVRVSGEGNIRAVPAPDLPTLAGFEIFAPEASNSVQASTAGLIGTKTFSYVLIPRAPGTHEVPPLSLTYYDPAENDYRTVTTDPIPLAATGTAVTGLSPGERGGVTALREDIRFIHLGAPALRRADYRLFASAAFWMFALLPVAGVAGTVALRRHRDRLVGDLAYARGRRAGRVGRKRLADARRLLQAADPRPFYAEVARALRGFAADRLNLAEAGLQLIDLCARLERSSVSASTTSEFAACLQHCDRQRFAPPAADPGERVHFLERAGTLVTRLDREIRR